MDVDINWNEIVYNLKTVFEPIYQSGIAGGIFYIFVTSLPIYKSKDIRLLFLVSNISDIILALGYIVSQIEESRKEKSGSESGKISESVKKNLCSSGSDVKKYTDAIISDIDILPNENIYRFNKIFMIPSYRRIYYSQFKESFSKMSLEEIENSLSEIIPALKKQRDEIDKLIN